MCNSPPAWLPSILQVTPWQHGGTKSTYDILYEIFHHDFITSKPRYGRHEVWCFPEMEDGKEKIFWHLTDREQRPKPVPRRKRHVVATPVQPERYPDFRRSERLPWVRPLIENAGQPEVLAWDYKEGSGDVHTYVWIQEQNFVVIMKKYPNCSRRIITSFYVDQEYKIKDFQRKYENRLP